MRKALIAFVAGLTFALGLVISGMTNPSVVIGFLDIFGSWDYSLILVMGGAVGVNLISFHWILKQPNPIFADKFYVPQISIVDAKLLGGSALFGIGWGLSGVCPGPALVNLVKLDLNSTLFAIAMLLGMFGHKLLGNYTNKSKES